MKLESSGMVSKNSSVGEVVWQKPAIRISQGDAIRDGYARDRGSLGIATNSTKSAS